MRSRGQVSFIAEVSSNHAQDLGRCIEFIETAANMGCSGIKFQLFRIEQLFAAEILERSEAHRARKAWELPTEFLPKIAAACEENSIDFLCSPFYIGAVDELKPFVSSYKIASYELLWDELLVTCAATGIPVILSTGMANLSEVQHAVSVLEQAGCKEITLLHCLSAYPAPVDELNLAAIETLKKEMHYRVGWSDHTVKPAVIQRAIHRWGAEVIEFHLDLDGGGAEYEAGHCWLPDQMATVIDDVKTALLTDGDGRKEPAVSEMDDREWRTDPADGLRPFRVKRRGL